MTTVLLTKAEVAERTGYHSEYVMQLVRQGKFPRPIKLGEGKNAATRFLESEVDEWIKARIAARDSE